MAKIESHPAGAYTFLCTCVLVGIAAYLMDGWKALFNLIPDGSNPVGTVLALVLVDVLASLILGYFFHFMTSTSSPESALVDVINSMEGKHNFSLFFVASIFEELYARWLFLGVLPTVLNPTPLVWWTLVVLGNGSWALFHLLNYEKKDRRVIWILPQLIGGLIFSLVYIKFGFLAAVFCHLGANALILSMHKVEDIIDKDIWLGAYSVLVAGVSVLFLFIMSKNFTYVYDLVTLLNIMSNGSAQLSYLTKWDWVGIAVLTTYFFKAISILFLYDAGMVEVNGLEKDAPKPWELALGLVLMTLLLSGLYTLASVFSPSTMMVCLLCSMLMCCLFRTNSGSGTARNFWLTIPKFAVLGLAWQYGGLETLALALGAIFVTYIPLFFLERELA